MPNRTASSAFRGYEALNPPYLRAIRVRGQSLIYDFGVITEKHPTENAREDLRRNSTLGSNSMSQRPFCPHERLSRLF